MFSVKIFVLNQAFYSMNVFLKQFWTKVNQILSISDGYYFLDNIICIHDLKSPTIHQICQLPKTRGATLFALDMQRTESLTGEKNTVVRLCVVVKRKLQLYYWKEKVKKFEDFLDELTVPDIPKELAWYAVNIQSLLIFHSVLIQFCFQFYWVILNRMTQKFLLLCCRCGETLVLGFRSLSYTLMDFNGTIKELFPTGKSPEPSITKLSDTSFALGKDSQSIIMDTKGDLVQHNPIKWSDSPCAIGIIFYSCLKITNFLQLKNLNGEI